MTARKQIYTRRLFLIVFYILAGAIFIFILSRNLYLSRSYSFRFNFSQILTSNNYGWYPAVRTTWQSFDHSLMVKQEPLYYEIYLPAEFSSMNISGTWQGTGPVYLGVKQRDFSWQLQEINQSFDLQYDLHNALRTKNKIALMLSIPTLQASEPLTLPNDWQVTFKR